MALTQSQINALNAFASGQIAAGAPQNSIGPIVVQPYPGCPQTGNVGVTQQTVPINVGAANVSQCGAVTLFVDMSSSAFTGSRQFVAGGCISGGDVTIATEMFGFPTTVLLADLDVANVIGPNSANYNPTLFMDWFQCQLENKNMIFSGLTAENTGDQTAFDTFKRSNILTSTLEMENTWGNCKSRIKSTICSPCPEDDDTAEWRGMIGLSGSSAMSLIFPNDLVATLTFCVFAYEGARNVTTCEGVTM